MVLTPDTAPGDAPPENTKPLAKERLERAVERATELFWRQGFENVSIEEIVQATGLNRYALYQAFGGKMGLFNKVLDRYFELNKLNLSRLLSSPDLTAVEAMRTALVDRVLDPTTCHCGCMMTNTAIELAPKDPALADRMMAYMDELRGMLLVGVMQAKADGSLKADIDPAGLVEILIALTISTAAQGRMGVPASAIVRSVDMALDQIRSPETT